VRLANHGASVVAVDRDWAGKDIIAAESGVGNIVQVAADVSNAEAVQHIFDTAAGSAAAVAGDGAGVATVLVNAAGITRDGWIWKLDDHAFDDVIDVNLKGPWLLKREFARRLLAQGGPKPTDASIVNISSIVGKSGNLGQTNYAASKAGLVGMTKAAAKELARHNIRVNAVLPGFIATPMSAAVPAHALEKILKDVPMRRMGTTVEVSNAIEFLASPASSYITGHALEVTGGQWM